MSAELAAFDSKDVCGIFKISRFTLWEWRRKGKFPPPLDTPTRTLRWSRSAIEEYLNSYNGKRR